MTCERSACHERFDRAAGISLVRMRRGKKALSEKERLPPCLGILLSSHAREHERTREMGKAISAASFPREKGTGPFSR